MSNQAALIPNSNKKKNSLPYQLLKMYRIRSNLTQQQLASALGLNSRRMVLYWEADTGLPKADNLRKLITVFLQVGAFRKGAERQEAEALWASVKDFFEARSDRFESYPIFDSGWFEDLLSSPPLAPLKSAEPTDLEEKAPLTPAPSGLPFEPVANFKEWGGLELTRFIGREKELADLQKLVQTTRLITLTGPGGCGKTRLALKVAEAVTPEFRDGVVFVNLANLTDPALVAPTVAQALGLQENRTSSLVETIKTQLKEQQKLLVLDNFEQLLGAVAWLTDLLVNTRFLKVLVTSRVVLNLYGEQHYPLAPLPLPSDDNAVATIETNPAVALFVDRARFYRPDFALTSANSQVIVQICTLLDGLPLALELAAARIKFLTPQKLLKKLEQHRLKLPGEPVQNLARRHQTLSDTLDWSYSLLPKSSQKLFRRLAVFNQEWTLEEAEKVCSGHGLDEADVTNLVAQLYNHSLLTIRSQSRTDEEEELYYYLLETIRAYALEKLVESGETEVWNKAITHFSEVGDQLRFANFAAARLCYSSALRAVSYLSESSERQRRQADLLVKYVSVSFAVVDRSQTLPQLDEAIVNMEGLLASPEGLAADQLRLGWLCYWAGYLLYFLEGAVVEEFPYWQKALAIAEELQHADLLVAVKTTIGRTLYLQGYNRQAAPYFEESIALLEKSGNWTARINANFGWALVLSGLGRHAESVAVAQKALVEAQQLGNLSRLSYAQLILGSNYLQARDFEQALHFGREGLRYTRQTGELNNVIAGLYICSVAAAALDYKAEAAQTLTELVALLEDVNLTIKPVALALAALSSIYLGHYVQALELTEQALALSEKMHNLVGLAVGQRGLAIALSKKGEGSVEEIKRHFAKALEDFERTGLEIEVANTYEDIGDFYQGISDNQTARAYYTKSLQMLKQFGLAKRVAELERRIA